MSISYYEYVSVSHRPRRHAITKRTARSWVVERPSRSGSLADPLLIGNCTGSCETAYDSNRFTAFHERQKLLRLGATSNISRLATRETFSKANVVSANDPMDCTRFFSLVTPGTLTCRSATCTYSDQDLSQLKHLPALAVRLSTECPDIACVSPCLRSS